MPQQIFIVSPFFIEIEADVPEETDEPTFRRMLTSRLDGASERDSEVQLKEIESPSRALNSLNDSATKFGLRRTRSFKLHFETDEEMKTAMRQLKLQKSCSVGQDKLEIISYSQKFGEIQKDDLVVEDYDENSGSTKSSPENSG